MKLLEAPNAKFVSNDLLAKEREHRKQLRESGQFNAPEIKKLKAIEAIESITDPNMKLAVKNVVQKAVQSYNLTGIRFVSYYDQVFTLANKQTIFRDICMSNGIYRSTDFQIRWREEQAGASTPAFFNLNAGLPAEAQLTRDLRGNTMGAYGNLLNIYMITEELAKQSPLAPTDEIARQLELQFVRMLRFSNSKLISNTEATSEIIGDTPQWGGFLTRSDLNATALAASSDLTAALIQTQVNAIANAASQQGIGFEKPLVALTTSAQIGKIRDLMVARFPGENSSTYLDYQAELLASYPNMPLPPGMVRMFQPDPGMRVAFVQEPQLPAGTCLFFDPTLPKVAKFEMQGQMGPWTIARPTPELTNLLCVFDFESLVDMGKETRASYTGLN